MMPRTEPVTTCDHCGRDLSYTGNCEDYRIVLKNDSIPSRGNVVTSMLVRAPLDGTAYFCGVPCLAMWTAEKYPNAKDGWERLKKHREWLASQTVVRTDA